ncbi:MAG TPA: SDR family NAD(P)-dependent oxidoreductase [Mycobacteriales bacterium]|nr:SDR family NAD(P)-dependent oxidoreductase [Mycobacteriales bacterium]
MTAPAGRVAVVTGGSSGIGEATARRLAADGWQVIAAARRRERLDALAAAVPGITAVTLDVTDAESVAALAAAVPRCDLLVANAGAAYGLASVAESEPDDWARMYAVNVVGVVRCVSALLPALVASGDGQVVLTGSTAGRWVYEGGGGYVAAKHAVAALRDTLRLELAGQPVRVSEIAPGMVRTEEFSLVRFDGDAERAAAVYAGVDALTADDVADAVAWVVSRPSHVNVDVLQFTPRQQASATKVARRPT